MACEFFDDGRPARCAAVDGHLIPTLHERERFCRQSGASCPTYKVYQLRGRRLSQAAYYALWLPPMPQEPESDRSEATLSL